jgi:hypothetical protein
VLAVVVAGGLAVVLAGAPVVVAAGVLGVAAGTLVVVACTPPPVAVVVVDNVTATGIGVMLTRKIVRRRGIVGAVLRE